MERNELGGSNVRALIYGSVYKSRSSWWYTTTRDGSDLCLSSKFKTKSMAKKHAQSKLEENSIDFLYVYASNDKLEVRL